MVRNCRGSAALHIDTLADPERPVLNVPVLIRTRWPGLFPARANQHS